MKKIVCIYILGAVAFGSCKSINKLAAKDNSASKKPKQTNQSADINFLESFSVTPGGTRSVIAESSPVVKTYKPTYNTANKNFNIETASSLQFKYAMMLDMPVEDLDNIALLKELDYWWGTKYCMGGSTESCIDCSAFTHNVLLDVYSTNIPRTAAQQYDSSIHIETSELQQGDLVFFQTTSRKEISHVGVYIGNNKFAHASVSNGVMISDLDDAYWKPKYRGAGRVRK